MDPESLLFAVLGIVLTIILSDPAIRLTKSTYWYMQRRAWSAQQYRKGNIWNKRHFGFEEWSVQIFVDADGSTRHEFEGRVVNLSNQLLRSLFIPFFSDSKGMSETELGAWAKAGRTPLSVRHDFLDEEKSQGRIEIIYAPPLRPGERRKIKWGFNLPRVFSPGDDYFNWDVEVPYYDMRGKIEFASCWKVLYAHWQIAKDRHFAPPVASPSGVEWKVMLPEPGTRLHLRIGLSKAELNDSIRLT